ncbi:HN1_G0002550.mRNA.1.CDS.1 [Saccharomyces cerevisiae]|nr:HN1_G0002550.mRNA.1.CDS.1 [Saccharomyces cerevisiae]CAI4415445.1 BAL_1a_G0016090.mRNA.1.CDS.1 [Saccharomyces cerevisiae]CAI7106188.1 BAL_1a_G0016090.mRNA.1.CDS.1 [Saccharomyces cerevisiae]
MSTGSPMGKQPPVEANIRERETKTKNERMMRQTKLLKDTLDLLWNKTLEQQEVCEQLKQENDYLEDYIGNLMRSSNVLEK